MRPLKSREVNRESPKARTVHDYLHVHSSPSTEHSGDRVGTKIGNSKLGTQEAKL